MGEREPTVVEYPTLAAADAVRDEHAEHLDDADDARRSEVAIDPGAPRGVVADAGAEAYLAWRREDRGAAGHDPLTEAERASIDFSRTNALHARCAKAVARRCGVEDWLARYDPSLSVGEHREVYGGEVTMRDLRPRGGLV